MQRDRHTDEFGGYAIRSLYFDSLTAASYFDKVEGLDNREKYRIRFYNRSLDYVCLEKKAKIGSGCIKTSTPLSAVDARLLCSRSFDEVEGDSPLIREFLFRRRHENFRPYFYVDYTRKAFCYPLGNVRITLDSDLSVSPFSEALAEKGGFGKCVLPAEHTILEIKFDAFLPPFLSALFEDIPKVACAISKYCLCFEAQLKEYV